MRLSGIMMSLMLTVGNSPFVKNCIDPGVRRKRGQQYREVGCLSVVSITSFEGDERREVSLIDDVKTRLQPPLPNAIIYHQYIIIYTGICSCLIAVYILSSVSKTSAVNV